jgi:hypothetical protein
VSFVPQYYSVGQILGLWLGGGVVWCGVGWGHPEVLCVLYKLSFFTHNVNCLSLKHYGYFVL